MLLIRKLLALLFLFLSLTGFCFEKGLYAGTGSAHTISLTTAITCDVKIVWVKARTGSFAGAMYIASLAADNSFDPITNGGFVSGIITNVGRGSFDVGTSTSSNNNGTNYDYAIWGNDGRSDFDFGTYQGNGSDNVTITYPNATFTAGFIFIHGASQETFFRTGTMAGDLSCGIFSATGCTTNRIQQSNAGNMQIGSNAAVNNNGTTYVYFIIKASITWFSEISYATTAVDNTDVDTFSLTPELAIIRCTNTTGGGIAYRFGAQSGDNSYIGSANNQSGNQIQNFHTNGIQIGTNSVVNTASSTCYVAAWSTPPAYVSSTRGFQQWW